MLESRKVGSSGGTSLTACSPHAKQIAHAPQPEIRSTHEIEGGALPISSDEKWPGTTASRRNRNALKHGHYTSEAVARRRQISRSVRLMKALALIAQGEC